MKTRLLLLAIATMLCTSQLFAQTTTAKTETKTTRPGAEDDMKAKVEWTAIKHDFGKIEQGKPVTYEFEFKNTGKVPLVISNVKAGCSCTATDYPKEPVQPGKTAKVKTMYSAGNPGTFYKTVTVYYNTMEGMMALTLVGEVMPKETPKEAPAPAPAQ